MPGCGVGDGAGWRGRGQGPSAGSPEGGCYVALSKWLQPRRCRQLRSGALLEIVVFNKGPLFFSCCTSLTGMYCQIWDVVVFLFPKEKQERSFKLEKTSLSSLQYYFVTRTNILCSQVLSERVTVCQAETVIHINIYYIYRRIYVLFLDMCVCMTILYIHMLVCVYSTLMLPSVEYTYHAIYMCV